MPYSCRMPLEKRPDRAADVEDGAPGVERGVSADDAILGDVELVHAVLDERRQHAPVPLLAVRDVAVVVVLADVLERHARVLVDEAAAAAGDEVNVPGLPVRSSWALMNGSLIAAAAEIAAHRLDERGRSGRARGCSSHELMTLSGPEASCQISNAHASP